MNQDDDARLSPSHVAMVRAEARADAAAWSPDADDELDATLVVPVPTELRGLLALLAVENGTSLEDLAVRAMREFIVREVSVGDGRHAIT